MDDGLGARFARAVAARDAKTLRELLDPNVDFRGLTPGRFWEASTATALVDDVLLGSWFEPEDVVEEVLSLETGALVDREHLAYRFRGTNPDGPFVVEQQAYFTSTDERITSLRMLCSGFRPLGDAET